MIRKLLFLFIITITMASFAPQSALATPGPGEVGSMAADWTLNAFGGGSHTLSDYQGKVVFMFVVGYG